VAHCGEHRRELLEALRHPDQRSHRIAQRRRLDQALECGQEPRIGLAQRPAPAAGAANTPFGQRRGVEIILAAIDGRTREPGDSRHRGETAPARRAHLSRRE